MTVKGKKVELSIVLPTYNEGENIELIVKEIFDEFRKEGIIGEVVVVDDNSPDGTGKLADSLRKKYSRLKVIHRARKEGLATAALKGFADASGEVVGLMDADRSHPRDKIGEMYGAIKKGADLVIGSRYTKGGSIVGWGPYRTLLSSTATLMAKPITRVKDPLAGYFMVKKSILKNKPFQPKGFRTLFEIIMIAMPKKIVEVPIIFTNRRKGRSKAGFREIFDYLNNIQRYYRMRLAGK